MDVENQLAERKTWKVNFHLLEKMNINKLQKHGQIIRIQNKTIPRQQEYGSGAENISFKLQVCTEYGQNLKTVPR